MPFNQHGVNSRPFQKTRAAALTFEEPRFVLHRLVYICTQQQNMGKNITKIYKALASILYYTVYF